QDGGHRKCNTLHGVSSPPRESVGMPRRNSDNRQLSLNRRSSLREIFLRLATSEGRAHLPAPAPGRGQMRVLVVEDEPEMRTMLRDGLREHGHAVAVASDGQ